MHNSYSDITRTLGAPVWWDEQAVPRYCKFHPNETADIYSREACLLEIACQDCGTRFHVCLSSGDFGFGPHGIEITKGRLASAVKDGSIHYGDPPNFGCCPAGPTMNSIPLRVIEFWQLDRNSGSLSYGNWQRIPSLERVIEGE